MVSKGDKKLHTADRWKCAPAYEKTGITEPLTQEEKEQVSKWREKILRKIEEDLKKSKKED